MTDYLTRLTERTLGLTPAVQPVVASFFAPAAGAAFAGAAFAASPPFRLEASLPSGDAAVSPGPVHEAGLGAVQRPAALERPAIPGSTQGPPSSHPVPAGLTPAFHESAPAPPLSEDISRTLPAGPGTIEPSGSVWRRVEPELQPGAESGPSSQVPSRGRDPAAAGNPGAIHPVVERTPRESEEVRLRTPTIRVTIGRIEVRAVLPPAPPVRRAAAPAPRLSLEEYLQARSEGQP